MRTETADVCIIGSGAGGAVVAWNAARRGLSTIVVERGPDIGPEQMSCSEPEMAARLYKHGGLQLNTSLDMFILQGSCVGGSTVVSNMVLLRADDEVFDRWRGLGTAVRAAEVHAGYDEVERRLGAEPLPMSLVSETNRRFMAGARSLGLEPRWMLKALGDCRGCGGCNLGCTFGAKRDARATWITWARDLGARVLPLTTVERIRTRRGHAEVVECVTGPDGEPLQVRARLIVVAAGAIGSSAVLLRSGIHKNVGDRLSFNAGSMLVAEYDEPLDAFDADQMNVYLKGDGYCIETMHNPIMSAALTTPGWLSDHGRLMRRYRNLGYAGALVATEPVGRVRLSRLSGLAKTRYVAPEIDVQRLKRGLREVTASFLASGAQRVFLPTARMVSLTSPAELGQIEDAFRSIREISFGSSHPQGGCCWSDDPQIGVVDRDLAVHGYDNLFVCDASVFPSSVGVNPIDTIMAVATLASPRILARF